MSKRIALFISIKDTLVPGFSNRATSGVDSMARNLQFALRNSYPNIRMVQGKVKKRKVEDSLKDASVDLEPGGFCLIYYHGHGHSIKDRMIPDETSDEAIVCYDGYLLDDELDLLLRQFHPSTRIMTIMDCCSSETIVEWKNFSPQIHPRIIHIAAAKDGDSALATTNGGILSREIEGMVDNWGYANYTYVSFLKELKKRMEHKNHPIYIRISPNVNMNYLKMELFT